MRGGPSGVQYVKSLQMQTGTQQLDWEQQGLQQLDWQQTGTQQLDWEQQGLQQLDWQQTGTQQLDWEQPQEPQPPLPQLEQEQEPQPPLQPPQEPQPPLPQLEQEQAGTQRHTGTQQLEPQPSEQPQQLMVLVGGEWRRSEEQEPQPPLPQLEQEQVGTQQHTGTQQLEPQPPLPQLEQEPQPPLQPPQEPQPPLPQLEQEQAGTQRHTGTQQLEPQPPEQPQQLMVLVGGEWRRSEEQVEREGRCSGVAPPGPGAFIPLPGSGEIWVQATSWFLLCYHVLFVLLESPGEPLGTKSCIPAVASSGFPVAENRGAMAGPGLGLALRRKWTLPAGAGGGVLSPWWLPGPLPFSHTTVVGALGRCTPRSFLTASPSHRASSAR
nr:mediator of RNA polymerase II transcription subunit 15-like [Camelus dromedarius]